MADDDLDWIDEMLEELWRVSKLQIYRMPPFQDRSDYESE